MTHTLSLLRNSHLGDVWLTVCLKVPLFNSAKYLWKVNKIFLWKPEWFLNLLNVAQHREKGTGYRFRSGNKEKLRYIVKKRRCPIVVLCKCLMVYLGVELVLFEIYIHWKKYVHNSDFFVDLPAIPISPSVILKILSNSKLHVWALDFWVDIPYVVRDFRKSHLIDLYPEWFK